MTDLSIFVEKGRGKVYATLLIVAGMIKAHDDADHNADALLAEGVLDDVVNRGSLSPEQADWVIRETRYRVACTLGAPVKDRNDKTVDAVLANLAAGSRAEQARVLELTADCVGDDHDD